MLPNTTAPLVVVYMYNGSVVKAGLRTHVNEFVVFMGYGQYPIYTKQVIHLWLIFTRSIHRLSKHQQHVSKLDWVA